MVNMVGWSNCFYLYYHSLGNVWNYYVSRKRMTKAKQEVWDALAKPLRPKYPWEAFNGSGWPVGEIVIMMGARSTGKTMFSQYYIQKEIDRQNAASCIICEKTRPVTIQLDLESSMSFDSFKEYDK